MCLPNEIGYMYMYLQHKCICTSILTALANMYMYYHEEIKVPYMRSYMYRVHVCVWYWQNYRRTKYNVHEQYTVCEYEYLNADKC